jgi:carbamoyl-phosphate synthase small subunit
MTAPQIGNYGVSPADEESRGPQAAGFIVREASPISSNWRAQGTLQDYFVQHNIVAIADVDTRALTRVLRVAGVMRGVIATGNSNPLELVARAKEAPRMEGADLVREVTCKSPYEWSDLGPSHGDIENVAFGIEPENCATKTMRVAAYDFGIKYNILRRLTTYGCEVRVFPATAPVVDLLSINPDGIFLSNGPGDPAAVPYAIENVRTLLKSDKPIFGICLGHQILGLASGGRTFKLKFGHRGSNHPVKDLKSGKIQITSQNHGFAVDPDSLPSSMAVTHLNLYDGTVEGFRHTSKPVFSVQYHPEASPGPHDADYLFSEFLKAMSK